MNNLKKLGIMCLLLALALAFVLNRPTAKGTNVSFMSKYKEKEVVLKGTYYEVEDAKKAVLICPGYSCDRAKWRPMADLFVANGFDVMLFDYSGQGESYGTIGFDNAKTDAIPYQIDSALMKLSDLSGIDYEDIILVGHSMGGRAILRLLYDYNDQNAVTEVVPKHIENVILMSAEVNYNYNAQASLFAGTSDESEEPWKSYTDKTVEGTNLYLFGSTADDIVKEEDVLALCHRLGGDVPESGVCHGEFITSHGSKVAYQITDKVLHSYIMYSSAFAKMVNGALEDITGLKMSYPSYKMNLVYIMWALSLVGLYLTLKSKKEKSEAKLKLIDSSKYLKWKAIMWIPGTIVALIICTVCVVMPFGSPVMNIPYMNFIAGYGIVMCIAYRKGHFKGTEGKLDKLSLKLKWDSETVLLGLLSCFVVWYVLKTSMYNLVPLNYRLFWLIFSTILMAIGYYVSSCERDMLQGESGLVLFIYNCIQYVPLFLLVGFYLFLKSYSGMIGQMQNMILMYIFCIPLGDLIKKRMENRFISSLVTALTFQMLMITSAALIAMF